MGHGIVDTLNQLLETLGSSSQYGSQESQSKLSTIRRALHDKKHVIETSRDPFVEGLSTILSAARNPDDGHHSIIHDSPSLNDSTSSANVGVSQMLELMRHQIDAMAGAQIQALSRQSSIASQMQLVPLAQYDIGIASPSIPSSRLESSRQSESWRMSEPHEPIYRRSHESSQTDPFLISMNTPPLSPKSARQEQSVRDHQDAGGGGEPLYADDPVLENEAIHQANAQRLYRPLSTLLANVTMVNVYLVAVEMTKSWYRSQVTQRDLFNYRAIDPSVYDLNGGVKADFSIQILAPNDSKQYHVNFGDIIRLKRVNVEVKYDKTGNKHFNIIMTIKNRPSMRLWQNRDVFKNEKSAENPDIPTQIINVDGQNEPSDLASLESEAVVIYNGDKTKVDHEDLNMVTDLRTWVREKLDALKVTSNREFLKTIGDSGAFASDCIVCVLEVAPEPNVNLVVSDATSVAVVIDLDCMLISNLLESHNRIQPGEWLKLRYVHRMAKPFQRADGSNYIALKACKYSCITRLPQLNLPYKKPIPMDSPSSKRARRMTRMKMWNSVSGLNPSFPRHLFGSTGYVDRLLEHHGGEGDEEEEFEKIKSFTVEESEEGEIQIITSK